VETVTTLEINAVDLNRNELQKELGKFLKVAAIEASRGTYHCNIPVPACIVEEYWRQFSAEKDFEEFMESVVDCSFEHVTNYEFFPASRGCGLVPWVKTYEKEFGPLHKLWFTNADGTFNSGQYSSYRKRRDLKTPWSWGGVLIASWNCTAKERQMRKDNVSTNDFLQWSMQDEVEKLMLTVGVWLQRKLDPRELVVPSGALMSYLIGLQSDSHYKAFTRHLSNYDVVIGSSTSTSNECAWVPLFEKMHGPLSDLWFLDDIYRLRLQKKAEYKKSGKLLDSHGYLLQVHRIAND